MKKTETTPRPETKENICKHCGETYTTAERNRVYGNNPLMTGYCSAGCYTEGVLMKETTPQANTDSQPEPSQKDVLFTKGDWAVAKEYSPNQDEYREIRSKGKLIARVFNENFEGTIKSKEAEANARLIAESKSLFYSLKRIVEYMKDEIESQSPPFVEAKEILNRISNH